MTGVADESFESRESRRIIRERLDARAVRGPLQPMSVASLRREAEEALDDTIRARRRLELVVSGLSAHDDVEPEICGQLAAITDQIRSNGSGLVTHATALHRRAQREAARGYGYLPTRKDAT